MRLKRTLKPILICASIFCAVSAFAESSKPDLVIYAYDSFAAKGGLGSEIIPLFEKKCGCDVRILPSGDGGQLLTRLQLDSRRGKNIAQVVIGLDEQSFERAKPWLESWGNWEPRGYAMLVPETKIEKGFLPLDYGVFAWIADQKALARAGLPAPQRLVDLLAARFHRNLLLEDPRTSTPGLAFLLYTQAVFGEKTRSFWRSLKTQWLTLMPGWDGAYGLFLKSEAPLVWSYSTSQAYHEEHGDRAKHRYRALLFDEVQPIQVEGAALVRNAPHLELAKEFLEFLISPEVQEKIPRKNWMLPVLRGVSLPASFEHLPKPKKTVPLARNQKEIEKALKAWSKAVEGGE